MQLPEILGEIAAVGPKSRSVTAQVTALVERFGPELAILGEVPLDDLAARAPSIVVEAIARLRRGEVRREAGYDGVYGTIRLFDPAELAGAALFDLPSAPRGRRAARPPATVPCFPAPRLAAAPAPVRGARPDSTRTSRRSSPRTRLPARGGRPGAGKTRVLTHAIAHRVDAGLAPERCLALTFTRRARDELRTGSPRWSRGVATGSPSPPSTGSAC